MYYVETRWRRMGSLDIDNDDAQSDRPACCNGSHVTGLFLFNFLFLSLSNDGC